MKERLEMSALSGKRVMFFLGNKKLTTLFGLLENGVKAEFATQNRIEFGKKRTNSWNFVG
jgi:hypothetical protein